jgi:hypothetical protein
MAKLRFAKIKSSYDVVTVKVTADWESVLPLDEPLNAGSKG